MTECWMCEESRPELLRVMYFDWSKGKDQVTCEECYTPPRIGDGCDVSGKGYIDGPDFTDLEPVK